MFNEKEINQINKYLSNESFICSVPFFTYDGPEYEVEYRFKVVGEKRMMSVGEYYMYGEIDNIILKCDTYFSKGGFIKKSRKNRKVQKKRTLKK